MTSAPSRRTPTCGSAPNTTTRCSSTTAAPRSSRFSSAPASPCAAGCSTPAAAAAACRCRSRKKRRWSSASIRSSGSSDAGVRLGRERGLRQPALRAGRRHGAALSGRRRSTWCCRTPSSSTSPTRRSTCASARACSRPADACTCRPRPYLSFAGAHLPRLKVPVPLHLHRSGGGSRSRRSSSWRGTRPGRSRSRPTRTRSSRRRAARRGQARRPAREGHASRACARQIADAGLAIVREELHVTATVRRLPAPLGALAARQPADAGRLHQQHGVRARARGSGPSHAGGRHRSLPAGRQARRRGAVPARVRPRRRRGQPAALGVAVPPQPEQSRAASPRSGSRAKGPAIVGQYATMPVQLSVKRAARCSGSWGMDVMVAPERQRQGLGEVLFRTWDRNVGASLGLGLSDVVLPAVPEAALAGRRPGAVPGQAADAAGAAPSRTGRSPINRLVSALTLPLVMIVVAHAPARRRSPAASSASTTASPSCGRRSRRSSTSPSGATPRT